MRSSLIAGNWKMYKTVEETKQFLRICQSDLRPDGPEMVVLAQSPLLGVLREGAPKQLQWGPQSIYWEEKGAFTGELSPALAREFGCTYALAGHSERRQFFGETDESAARRALAAHAFGMKAIFCVGERLEERDSGRTMEILRSQCAALFVLTGKAPVGFCFAYEPVWAIGTGRTASPAQAQEAHEFLRSEIGKAWGEEAADRMRILYGGSVKPENAKELLGQPDVDGALIGGASLDPVSFLAIAAASKG